MNKNFDLSLERQEQIARGKRIKQIREDELKLTKTELAKKLCVSSQFLGLVEEGKSNLVYKSIKLLRDLSGHSADYILYGLDDSVLNQTKALLEKYDEKDIIEALNILKNLYSLLKSN